jgi:3-deoxy-D-manno-octulosonic-acid transferase
VRNAARRVADADELKLRLQEDLDDPEAAAERGEAGRSFVLAQHGASVRTLSELDRLVESSMIQKSA